MRTKASTPKWWSLKMVGDLAEFRNGSAFNVDDWSDAGVPIVRIQNLNGSFQYNHYRGDMESCVMVEPGDLLFSWSGNRGTSFGPFLWNGPRGVLNQHIFKVTPKPGLETDFVFHLLRNITSRIEGRAHGGTGIVHITKGELTGFHILLPSSEEQRGIASILNSVDKAIESTQAVIDQTARLKSALLQELFTHGLPGQHRRFRTDKHLDRVPETWKVCTLESLCESTSDGPFGSNLKTEHYTGEGIRVIRLQNVGEGDFDDTDKAFIAEEHFHQLRRYRVKEGDIIMASMGDEAHPAGRACSVPKDVTPAIIKADCFRLRVGDHLAVSGYLMWYLNSPLSRRSIDRSAHGQTRLRLNLFNARRIPVPVPDISEQKAIADAIQSVHSKWRRDKFQLDQLSCFKRGLAQVLLTGRVAVSA